MRLAKCNFHTYSTILMRKVMFFLKLGSDEINLIITSQYIRMFFKHASRNVKAA